MFKICQGELVIPCKTTTCYLGYLNTECILCGAITAHCQQLISLGIDSRPPEYSLEGWEPPLERLSECCSLPGYKWKKRIQESPPYTSNRLTHRDSARSAGLKTDYCDSHTSPGMLNYRNTDIKYRASPLRAPCSFTCSLNPTILIFTSPSGIYETPLSCKYANIPAKLAAGHKYEAAALG